MIFYNYPSLLSTFSTKTDGNMRIKPSGDLSVDSQAKNNRTNYFHKLGIDPALVVSPILEHGSNVIIVTKQDAGKTLHNADALITNAANIFLSITVADCMPIYIYDPSKKAIALVHAGWKGLAADIITKTITAMQSAYATNLEDLIVSIGPSICVEHYEVKNDVASKFNNYAAAIIHKNDKIYLNIQEIAKKQLLQLGIKPENIEISSECTYGQSDKYFSFRRDGWNNSGPMVAVFGMR